MEKEHIEKKTDAYDKYLLVRKNERPRARDLIPKIFNRFVQYKEGFPYDPNIIGGFAELEGQSLFVIGQNWRTEKEKEILTTVSAKGFSLALEIMHLAEKHQKPLITFIDTPGGDPLEKSAELLQCWKISDCLNTLARLEVPTISVIIGEGGSGGALALLIADRTYMLENAVFSVISPEGCAGILIKNLNEKPRDEKQNRYREMANLLKPTPQDMLEIGIIDGIIKEPGEGAHANPDKTAKNIRSSLAEALKEIKKESIEILLAKRYKRYISHGRWQEEKIEAGIPLVKKLAGKIFGGLRKIFKRRKKPLKETEADLIGKEGEDIQKKFYVCKNKLCRKKVPFKKYLKNYRVCPECGSIDRKYHPSAYDWINYLIDRGSFEEKDKNLIPSDPINFSYKADNGVTHRYQDDIEKDQEKTKVKEALIIGTAKIKGQKVVLAVSEYDFRGGSLSSVVGEKFARAVNCANKKKCPLISVSMSGGARMQEGIHSLMQMAKTNMALTRRHIPYISILADPTMAGSLSSYVSQGDIHLAEANAEIGFAGARIVEGYLKTEIRDKEGHSPQWYSANFYLERGGINEIVPREKMRDRVHEYLKVLRKFWD